ncbi:MAG: Hsp70 family protein [Polyangiaceae bacterium]|nr:Hsp70 family protein [Polyangiaceae bacterium]MCE7889259.1 Hsp70 family protein [Sorangiineae bacterium PRO1]MCL4755210.1 Hsp70 family protein [Myxococcales bacterium]
MSARFAVGIDLGTTHTALAAVALEGGREPEVLALPQLVATGTLEARVLLPSFLYFAHESEGALALPWDAARRFAVGEHARTRASESPARVVSSAKSWLCHDGVDRRGPILPPGAPDDIEKISPVEASFRYLDHLAEAFLAKHGVSLGEQEVMLTVPASFDAAARDLTVEAAYAAGLENVTLLEEPQAALYAWIADSGEGWRTHLRPGDVVLVVDVGGGTTDFSAIATVERDGLLELHRIAVGDHILLGGDNMDLALAHVVAQKLRAEGKELDRWQLAALTHTCRGAKERLLSDAGAASAPIAVAGRGSALLGNTLKSELTREEVARVLVDGFFPVVPASARPATRARVGLTQLGLPYAADPAVTKHLAAFLTRQVEATDKLAGFGARHGALLHPSAVLFNGGVVKGEALRARLLEALGHWLQADGAPAPRVLPGADPDLAVARGAAYFGLVRRGKGLKIRGGTARAYYVGIESPAPAVPGIEPPITALCVAPFGMEEGTHAELPPHELGLVVGEPVRFRFFGSSVRRDDRAGTELERWTPDELEELSPIEIELPAEGRREGDVVPVELAAQITPVGTLLLEAVPREPREPNERWKLELGVRN